jgi:hypothetical protein
MEGKACPLRDPKPGRTGRHCPLRFSQKLGPLFVFSAALIWRRRVEVATAVNPAFECSAFPTAATPALLKNVGLPLKSFSRRWVPGSAGYREGLEQPVNCQSP